MKAADIMTVPVHTVLPDDTVAQAVRLMLQYRVSGLPVADKDGALLGIVTEGDFLRRSEIGTAQQRPNWLQMLLGPGRTAEAYTQTHARLVGEVMTTDVATVTEQTPLADIVQLMEKRHVKRLPVLRGRKLVGIVSRANLLHAFAGVLADVKPARSDDSRIRQQIVEALRKESWGPVGSTEIIVRDGVVHLWGTIFDDRERTAMKVLAEGVPGVKGVQDHMIWIEPLSGMYLTPPAS
jgi:CBS-domain-containing membrane protein